MIIVPLFNNIVLILDFRLSEITQEYVGIGYHILRYIKVKDVGIHHFNKLAKYANILTQPLKLALAFGYSFPHKGQHIF